MHDATAILTLVAAVALSASHCRLSGQEQAVSSSHGPFSQHFEQGHSRELGAKDGLTPKELWSARKRFSRNKGCQYQTRKVLAPRGVAQTAPPECCRDWLGGENNPHPKGGTIFPWPCTLKGMLWKTSHQARREGWGGLASRRDYRPVFVSSYKQDNLL